MATAFQYMKQGDTILDVDGKPYEVERRGVGSVLARSRDTRQLKAFNYIDLFCVDSPGGLWQQTQTEGKADG